MRSVALSLALSLAVACPALAQSAVVLRPDASLAPLAPAIVRGLARRTGRDVAIGAALDDPHPRDLGPTTVGLTRDDSGMTIFAIAPSGSLHVTHVGAAAEDRTTTRVLTVALTSFVEALDADVARPRTAEAPPPAPRIERYELPIDGSALEDLAPPYRVTSYDPHALIELRGRASYATQSDGGSGGGGLSAGVCFGPWWCAQLDVDAIAPETDRGVGTGTLSYWSSTIGVGGRFLPLEAGPVRGGVGLDLTTRVARLWTEYPPRAPGDTTPLPQATDRIDVSAGLRFLFDVAFHLGDVLWLALELGADVSFNAVRYVTASGRPVFGEDVLTLWGAIALRFQ